MTVKEAAKVTGLGEQTIRIGLQQGALEFGTAFKREGSNSFIYVIYPERVYELYGRGNENGNGMC